MAVYRKEHLQPYLIELESYYQALRRAVEGLPPEGNLAPLYHANPDQFAREYREVDLARVKYQIAHFRAAVEFLKGLTGAAQPPVSR